MRRALAALERPLGVGIGYRPELAVAIDRCEQLGFIELLAEQVNPFAPVPDAVRLLQERGARVVVHAIGLSLGGAEPLDFAKVDHLARVAEKYDAMMVSEHLSFVRAGGIDSGHLLPLPFTEAALDVLTDNVAQAKRVLQLPLVLENVAALVRWPDAEMEEARFVTEAVRRTGCQLLLDVANLYANAKNHRFDARGYLDALPLDRLGYVHIAGGVARGGLYLDTHAHPVPNGAFALAAEVVHRAPPGVGVMLERDDHFPPEAELRRELGVIAGLLDSDVTEAPASTREVPRTAEATRDAVLA